jgi:phosphate transport system ATP-binding protein
MPSIEVQPSPYEQWPRSVRSQVALRGRSASGEVPPVKLRVMSFSLWYGAFQAIGEISLDIPARRITALIGPSGCGKSTLLRSINRMTDLAANVRTSGAILLDQIALHDPALDVVQLRRRVGMVFQRPNPFPMSIFDNVAYGLRYPPGAPRLSKRELANRVEHSLRQAALWDEVKDQLRRPALALSGGQQQRLCIARAVAIEPEVLLLDEPTSALDPIATLKIEELMVELSQRYTLVVVTHNMQQAARAADFTALLLMDEQRTGRLVEFGSTNQLFTAPRHQQTEAYLTGRYE